MRVCFTQEVANEGVAFLKQINNIPYVKRVYVDETWASSSLKKQKGRFPRGQKKTTPQNRKYPRMTIVSAMRLEELVRPSEIYNKGSIKTGDFEIYVKKKLCPKLRDGDVVFWDRLGRSGKAKNPKALHFSPSARQAIEKRGATLIILPRAGKYFDPMELIFGDIKKKYNKKLRQLLRSTPASKIPFDKKVRIWRGAEKELDQKYFKRAFKERARGQEFSRVYKKRGLL